MRTGVRHPFAEFAKGWRLRWLAVLAVVAIVTTVCAFSAAPCLHPCCDAGRGVLPQLFPLTDSLRPNSLHSSTGRDLLGLRVDVDDPHRVVVESVVVDHDSAIIIGARGRSAR